jgi:hypothetical protein
LMTHPAPVRDALPCTPAPPRRRRYDGGTRHRRRPQHGSREQLSLRVSAYGLVMKIPSSWRGPRPHELNRWDPIARRGWPWLGKAWHCLGRGRAWRSIAPKSKAQGNATVNEEVRK